MINYGVGGARLELSTPPKLVTGAADYVRIVISTARAMRVGRWLGEYPSFQPCSDAHPENGKSRGRWLDCFDGLAL